MLGRLDGLVVAVAGAGGSLGPVVSRRLCEEGARACLCGRDLAKLEPLAAELEHVGGGAEATVADLLDPDSARSWADGLVARHGRVDGLLHLVGGWRGGMPIEESPAEDWEWLEASLVRTLQNATRAFVEPLLASGRGRVAIVSSGQAQAPTQRNAAYAAAKAAAEAWTLALADRFKGSGSTANIVVVGAIVTAQMRAEKPEESFAGFTPAEDIAEALVYLCSESARTMNGQRLVLRGAA